jgi:hypothetical protein
MLGKDTQYGQPLFIDNFTSGTAKPMKRNSFSKGTAAGSDYDESWLQGLIMRHPRLLPVDQIEPAFADLVPICMELPTPSGPLDNLLVTRSGGLSIVECKLWRNPGARREVVGQIIDYAKNLPTWSYEELQEAINCAKFLEDANGETPRDLYMLSPIL